MFKDLMVKEVYSSIFYLFMRDDQFFINKFKLEMQKNGFLVPDLQEHIEFFKNKFVTYIEEKIRNENNFSMEKALESNPAEPRYLPSTNPLYSINNAFYDVP